MDQLEMTEPWSSVGEVVKHFNDSLFVSFIRAAFLGALDVASVEGLRSDELGAAQQRALGFEVGVVDANEASWTEPTSALAKLLGRWA